jgi:hypothetical protein
MPQCRALEIPRGGGIPRTSERVNIMRYSIWATVLIPVMAASPVNAADEAKRPEVFDKLMACRQIADGAARLACFDTQAARLEEAADKSEVVVVDRAEVRKARRGLFGLTLGDLGSLFGKNEPEQITQIESTIRQVAKNGEGKYVFLLEDGARWAQTDRAAMRTPKPGMPIKIRKAAMGSYMANIADRTGFKVMRLN